MDGVNKGYTFEEAYQSETPGYQAFCETSPNLALCYRLYAICSILMKEQDEAKQYKRRRHTHARTGREIWKKIAPEYIDDRGVT